MEFTERLIEQVSELSALELEEEEREKLRGQLKEILDHVRSLEELDLEDVEPLTHPVSPEEQFREDRHEEGLAREDLFRNAPRVRKGYFEVPPVLK